MSVRHIDVFPFCSATWQFYDDCVYRVLVAQTAQHCAKSHEAAIVVGKLVWFGVDVSNNGKARILCIRALSVLHPWWSTEAGMNISSFSCWSKPFSKKHDEHHYDFGF